MNTTTTPLSFACDVCNKQHDISLNLGFSMPDFVNKLLPWEREKRCQSSPDWAIVDERFFYVRGCIELKVQGTDSVFSLGVWTTLGEDEFDRTMQMWDNPERLSEPPYNGALANTLPLYPETRNLTTLVHTRAPGDRPAISIVDETHQLYEQQQHGIPFDQVVELTKLILHGGSSNPWGHLCER
jgi:hypothetical protein